jgi:hypothetical protein
MDLIHTCYRVLAGEGIEPERPPYTVREGGSRLCFVRDPDGNRLVATDYATRQLGEPKTQVRV